MLEREQYVSFNSRIQMDCNLICVDMYKTFDFEKSLYVEATLLEELRKLKEDVANLKCLYRFGFVKPKEAYHLLSQVKQAIHNESLQAYKENYTAILHACNDIEQIIDGYF